MLEGIPCFETLDHVLPRRGAPCHAHTMVATKDAALRFAKNTIQYGPLFWALQDLFFKKGRLNMSKVVLQLHGCKSVGLPLHLWNGGHGGQGPCQAMQLGIAGMVDSGLFYYQEDYTTNGMKHRCGFRSYFAFC